MSNIFLILIVLSLLLFLSFLNKTSEIKKIIIAFTKDPLKKQEFNPDINTNNWELHKLRLVKFRRSQYKGLTFFLSSEDKIYYLSEKGSKVYC